jgi:hypothetical protein
MLLDCSPKKAKRLPRPNGFILATNPQVSLSEMQLYKANQLLSSCYDILNAILNRLESHKAAALTFEMIEQ